MNRERAKVDRGGNNVNGDEKKSNRGGNAMYGGRIIANGDKNTANIAKGCL